MSNDLEDKSLEDLFASVLLKESSEKIKKIVEERIKQMESKALDRISAISESIDSKVSILESKTQNKPLSINIGTVEKPKNIITHSCFDKVIKVLQSAKRINKNIMLVGPAGSGKSSLCGQIAEVLKLQFYPMSVGLQTTKSDLLGFINAKGDYITSPIRQAYENGGVLLLDEFDATHAGVVTILNSMLANDFCSFPDKIITKHPDFICFVACNTYGKGGSIDYVGRNRLDGATLDRFVCINVDYDNTLEKQLTSNDKWLKMIQDMRKNIETFGLKIIISPRASMQGADLLEAGFELEEVLEMCVYKGLNSDTKNKLMKDIDFKDVKKANKIFKPKNKKDIVEINIDFDNGEYNVKGLDKDISIIGCTDWDSVISIYIACGQQWASGLVENSLYLNSGSDKMYKRPCNHSINKLINELNEHSNNVTVENDVIIDLNIIHNGVRTEHRLGV